MFNKWGGQHLHHNHLLNILLFLIVPSVALSLVFWWLLKPCSELLEQFLTWFCSMPISLWQFLCTGVKLGQELVPVDTVEKSMLFWKLTWTIWTEVLHAFDPGTSELSWEHKIAVACVHNTAHTGSSYTWKWTSVLCIRSQRVKQRALVCAHCLRYWPCMPLTVYAWKRDRNQFSSLFSVSYRFLSLIISSPYYFFPLLLTSEQMQKLSQLEEKI